MSKNKDYTPQLYLKRPLGVPSLPYVLGTTLNFLCFHRHILNLSPNTNSNLSFKLENACKTTAVMFGGLSIINTEGGMMIFLMTTVGVVGTTRGGERVKLG